MNTPLRLFALAACTPGVVRAAATAVDTAPAVSTAGSLLQVFIGLLAVLLLIAVTAWLAKRLGVNRGGGGSVAQVVSSTAVGTRERVVIVEIGETWLVVGVAAGSVNALTTLPKGSLPATPPSMPPLAASFANRLQQVIEKRHAK
jgi:flagellar protein FliO/FliZ